MTIICVKDGIMAVDSEVSAGSVRAGTIKKWRAVPANLGGGFIAASGGCSGGDRLMASVLKNGMAADTSAAPDNVEAIWLRADGSVAYVEKEGTHISQGPFFAVGGGYQVAIGAMAFGASAEEAVAIVCQYVHGCGGPVVVLSV